MKNLHTQYAVRIASGVYFDAPAYLLVDEENGLKVSNDEEKARTWQSRRLAADFRREFLSQVEQSHKVSVASMTEVVPVERKQRIHHWF